MNTNNCCREIYSELYRVRTSHQAAAHALDVVRQELQLDLIHEEHPMDTAKRILTSMKEADGE